MTFGLEIFNILLVPYCNTINSSVEHAYRKSKYSQIYRYRDNKMLTYAKHTLHKYCLANNQT